jgi:hypothetical protein
MNAASSPPQHILKTVYADKHKTELFKKQRGTVCGTPVSAKQLNRLKMPISRHKAKHVHDDYFNALISSLHYRSQSVM